MATPTWKGSRELTEGPNSPEWFRELEKTTITRTYTGPYETCIKQQAELGAAMSDLPPDFKVASVRVTHMAGGAATMVVTLTNLIGAVSLLNPKAPLPPNEEEYVGGTTERHLGAHPNYKPEWLGNPQTNGKDDPRGNPTTVPTKKGAESYFIPTAIYRRTTWSKTVNTVDVSLLGKRGAPPGTTLPANQTLKTAHTMKITQGSYQHIEEWTCVVNGTWDTDIYP